MVIESVNNQYDVRTFLDMQIELADYLKETHLEDGVWTVAQKQKRLNQGCMAFVTNKAHPLAIANFQIEASTSTEPIREVRTPSNLLKPGRLFIDGFEYFEQTLATFVNRQQGLVNNSAVTGASLSSVTNLNFRFRRMFWWDATQKVLQITPDTSNTASAQLYYLAAPKFLVNDDDVSNLPIGFTYMPAAWAAWKLLPKDEEQRDRGRLAKADWDEGIKEYERFRSRTIGNKVTKINLDKNVFLTPLNFPSGGRVDLGVFFDRAD